MLASSEREKRTKSKKPKDIWGPGKELSKIVVSCAVPVWKVSWILFQEGRSPNFS